MAQRGCFRIRCTQPYPCITQRDCFRMTHDENCMENCKMIISLGAGPWDALFDGRNTPAFVLAFLSSLATLFKQLIPINWFSFFADFHPLGSIYKTIAKYLPIYLCSVSLHVRWLSDLVNRVYSVIFWILNISVPFGVLFSWTELDPKGS